jgi:hypothetical protein
MPIVLYDANFWDEVIDMRQLYKKGLVSKNDLGLFKIANSVDEAFEYLKDELSRHYINIPTSLLNKSAKGE